MKKSVMAAAAMLIILLVPATASAHGTISPLTAPTSVATTFSIEFDNIEKSDLVSLTMPYPEGIDNIQPIYTDRWDITLGDRVIKWKGVLPPRFHGTLKFNVYLPGKPRIVTFAPVATYADGKVDVIGHKSLDVGVIDYFDFKGAAGEATKNSKKAMAIAAIGVGVGLAGLCVAIYGTMAGARPARKSSRSSRKKLRRLR